MEEHVDVFSKHCLLKFHLLLKLGLKPRLAMSYGIFKSRVKMISRDNIKCTKTKISIEEFIMDTASPETEVCKSAFRFCNKRPETVKLRGGKVFMLDHDFRGFSSWLLDSVALGLWQYIMVGMSWRGPIHLIVGGGMRDRMGQGPNSPSRTTSSDLTSPR